MGARAVALLRDDAARVLAACPDTPAGRRDAALVTVMREAMLRGIEASALAWDDITCPNGGPTLVTIRRSKTNPFAVALDVSDRCVARLDAWRPHAPELLVFGLSVRSIGYVIRRAGERAGVPGLSAHSCRRGAAQDMALADIPAERIMARGRWRKMTTAQRYIDETVPMLARGVPDSVLV